MFPELESGESLHRLGAPDEDARLTLEIDLERESNQIIGQFAASTPRVLDEGIWSNRVDRAALRTPSQRREAEHLANISTRNEAQRRAEICVYIRVRETVGQRATGLAERG